MPTHLTLIVVLFSPVNYACVIDKRTFPASQQIWSSLSIKSALKEEKEKEHQEKKKKRKKERKERKKERKRESRKERTNE
jgi:hypothetical protein